MGPPGQSDTLTVAHRSSAFQRHTPRTIPRNVFLRQSIQCASECMALCQLARRFPPNEITFADTQNMSRRPPPVPTTCRSHMTSCPYIGVLTMSAHQFTPSCSGKRVGAHLPVKE